MNSQIAVCLDLPRGRSVGRGLSTKIYTPALDAPSDGPRCLPFVNSAFRSRWGDALQSAPRHLGGVSKKRLKAIRPGDPTARMRSHSSYRTSQRMRRSRPICRRIQAEGIAAMAFIPLTSVGGVIGKFMPYYDAPHTFTADELQLSGIIASQIAFAVRADPDRGAGKAEVRNSCAVRPRRGFDGHVRIAELATEHASVVGQPRTNPRSVAGAFDGTLELRTPRSIHAANRKA